MGTPPVHPPNRHQPPFDTHSLHSNSKLHLYLLSTPPSYIPSLHTQHCRILSWYSSIAAGLPTGHKTTQGWFCMTTPPPLTLPFCTLTLNFIFTSSLHPLSTSTLYILSIVEYCHGTAQSPLGSRLRVGSN